MNLLEARDILVLIESYDRRPFRPEAVDLWFAAMRSVTAEDATAAVHQIFRISGHDKDGNIRKLLPIDVVRPAQAIGEARRRQAILEAQRKALSATPERPVVTNPTGRPIRSAEAEAAVARARARIAEAEARYREPVAA